MSHPVGAVDGRGADGLFREGSCCLAPMPKPSACSWMPSGSPASIQRAGAKEVDDMGETGTARGGREACVSQLFGGVVVRR